MDQSIIPWNSVACGFGDGITLENSFYRTFDLSWFGITGALDVTSVDMGIEVVLFNDYPFEINLYQDVDGGVPHLGDLVLLGTSSGLALQDSAPLIMNIPVTGRVAAGATLVVEFHYPSGLELDPPASMLPGSNPFGETECSYISAPDCGIVEPFCLSYLSFIHLVMNVYGVLEGSEADCNDNGVPDCQDIVDGTSEDCNANGIPDECDIADGTSPDCQPNGTPDECDLFWQIEDFEGGLPAGWSASGLWHVGAECPRPNGCDPTQWAYYGQDAACDFDVGATSGVLTTPALDLPDVFDSAVLVFCSAYGGEGGDSPNGYDAAWVSANGIEVDDVSGDGDQYAWETRTVDLTPFAGQTVVLRWHFDSQDDFENGEFGWQIDDVRITGAGPSPGDCNDNGVPDDCDPEFTDIGLFVAQLLAESQDPVWVCMFDQTGDGLLQGDDIQGFVTRLLSPP